MWSQAELNRAESYEEAGDRQIPGFAEPFLHSVGLRTETLGNIKFPVEMLLG